MMTAYEQNKRKMLHEPTHTRPLSFLELASRSGIIQSCKLLCAGPKRFSSAAYSRCISRSLCFSKPWIRRHINIPTYGLVYCSALRLDDMVKCGPVLLEVIVARTGKGKGHVQMFQVSNVWFRSQYLCQLVRSWLAGSGNEWPLKQQTYKRAGSHTRAFPCAKKCFCQEIGRSFYWRGKICLQSLERTDF